jgi:hypothetical protein
MKRNTSLLLAVAFIFLITIIAMPQVSAAWWNVSYTNTYNISVYGPYGQNWTNYSVYLNITYNWTMNRDFSDLRFIDVNGNKLPYWIENKTNYRNAMVWVKMDLTTRKNNVIQVYYGNRNASSESNSSQAFWFYDDNSVNRTQEYNWSSDTGNPIVYPDWNGSEYIVKGGNTLGFNSTGSTIIYPAVIGNLSHNVSITASIREGQVPYTSGIFTRGTGEVNPMQLNYNIRRLSGSNVFAGLMTKQLANLGTYNYEQWGDYRITAFGLVINQSSSTASYSKVNNSFNKNGYVGIINYFEGTTYWRNLRITPISNETLGNENKTFTRDLNDPGRPFTGLGTNEIPFRITNWTEMNSVRNYPGLYFILNNSLDSSTPGYVGIGDNWQPIGNASLPFSVWFNGSGNNISHLIINHNTNNVGLFGYIIEGNITGLHLYNATIHGLQSTGGIVGSAYNMSISYCSFTQGNISGQYYVGGLVGTFTTSLYNNNSISYSYSTGSLYSDSYLSVVQRSYAGGLAGYMTAGSNAAAQGSYRILNSYSKMNMTTTGHYVGGLSGYVQYGQIRNSLYYGLLNVSGGNTNRDGGITPDVDWSFVGYQNTYHDKQFTGILGTIGGREGLPTAAMKNIFTFQTNYSISKYGSQGTNDDYPYLFPRYEGQPVASTWGISDTFVRITIVAPIPGTNVYVNNVTINYTYSNSSWIDWTNTQFWYTNNSGVTNISLPIGQNISANGNWPEGLTHIDIYSNTTNGTVLSAIAEFTTDSLYPDIRFTSPSNGDIKVRGTGGFNITVLTIDNNLDNQTLYIWNSTYGLVYKQNTSNGTLYYNFNPTGVGVWYINATAWDQGVGINKKSNTTETYTLEVQDFSFGICNTTAPFNRTFLNITFYNEDDPIGTKIRTRITDMVVNYYLLDPLVNRTYTFQNLTHNPSYVLCALPASYTFTISNIRFTYSNTTYAQRDYQNSVPFNITNVTTQLQLPMLLLSNAQFTSLVTMTAQQIPISGTDVKIWGLIQGVSTLLYSGTTDSAGAVATYLNPLKTYTVIYTKAGYVTLTQTLQPILPSYNIVLQPDSSGGVVGLSDSNIDPSKINWTIYHLPNTDWFPKGSKLGVFFNVSETTPIFGGIRIEFWDMNNTMLNSTTVNVGGTMFTNANLYINMTNNISITGKFFIFNSTNPTKYYLVYSEVYRTDQTYVGNYSLKNGLNGWSNYTTSQGFQESFSNAWWVFFILCIIIAGFCLSTGVELTNPMAISLGFTMVLGLLASANLLYIPGLYNEFTNKYIIVIISGLFNVGYLANVWRERG